MLTWVSRLQSVTRTALPSPTGNAVFTGVCDVLLLTWVGQLQPLGLCYLFYPCLRCFSAYVDRTVAAARTMLPSATNVCDVLVLTWVKQPQLQKRHHLPYYSARDSFVFTWVRLQQPQDQRYG